jgi:predicted PolB exonuclease-like 3'-5' exonuclease
MHTNLMKVGGKWAVEVIGGPDEETLVKTFSGREQATNQIRMWNSGQSDMPVLKKKGAAKKEAAPKTAKPKAKAKSKKSKKSSSATSESPKAWPIMAK